MNLFLSNRKNFLSLIPLLLFSIGNTWAAERLSDVMERRGMAKQEILAAAKTYVPIGQPDEYVVFSAGGLSGQVVVYGIPSMRIFKYIAVFTPEPWQGEQSDLKSNTLVAQGRIQDREITVGNSHYPVLSETDGEYDGEYLFINDKANPRTAVIDLHDFETKQIVVNPVLKSSHTGTAVSENTEYLLEAAQYPAPYENKYVPIVQFNEHYRNGMTYWHFDRQQGRIDPKKSFTVMTPPYGQGQSDFGKGPSSDWSFTNTVCSGSNETTNSGNQPPFQSQCSASNANLLMVNWRQASKLVETGQATRINNHHVITLDTAIKEGILYLIGTPEKPRSVDVSPDGQYLVVIGQSDDTSTLVYGFDKLQTTIANGQLEGKDSYGIPIIAMKKGQHLPVELGQGPLYTQYDAEDCVAYTLLTEESMMAKWDYCQGQVLAKMAIDYRLDHFITMHGNTKTPEGQYLLALTSDRFSPIGLPLPNHQLLDLRGMELLKDIPLPLGDAHYAVAINAILLKPEAGSALEKNVEKRSRPGTNAGSEEIKKTPDKVEVFGTISHLGITPAMIEVEQGDEVVVHLTYLESTEDSPLQFTLYGQNLNRSIESGQTTTFRLVADNPGVYPIYGSDFSSTQHSDGQGYLLVKPKTVQQPNDEEGELLVSYTKADYEKQVKDNLATRIVFDQIKEFLSRQQNSNSLPKVVALMEEAHQQLEVAHRYQAKAELAAVKEDWQNAVLWAIQWWQFQVKTADLGLHAKTSYLDQFGANKTPPPQPTVTYTQADYQQPDKAETPTAPVVTTTNQADYEQLMTDNQAQQASLEKALIVILTQNYYQFPEIDALVKESLNQLNLAKVAEDEAKLAAEQQDWSKAMAQATKWQQSQKQTAPLVSRATTMMADKLDGEQLYSDKGCTACHGTEGQNPLQPNYPMIAGQAQDYLMTQMMAIKSGARDNGQTALMKGIIASVKPAEIKAIAKWLASLETEAGDINLETSGAKLYLEQSCHGCHGADAKTPLLASYPKLVGQNEPYIVAQMKDIQSGSRHHDQTPIMKPLIQSLTEAQLQTIAGWLAEPGLEAVMPAELDGEQLYTDKGCTACHGTEGQNPLQPNYPMIAGQAQDYLVTQMMAIKSGARDNGQTALMKGIIASVKPAEIKAIAKWLASLETEAGNINLETSGAKLYLEQSCHGCHGADAKTPLLASYPKLVGQNEPYIVAQMKDIQSGSRHHDQTPIMKPLIQSLTEAQLQTIAGWLAEPGQEAVMPAELDGEQLYTDKGCTACHGTEGQNPLQPNYPMIAGQAQDYLVTQMMAIKSGARDNGQTALMKGIIASVKPAEIKAIAKWLASLETEAGDINLETSGAKLYLERSCHGCHGADAKTPLLANYPKLVGQNEPYLVAQMKDIQSGSRHHDQTPIMKPLIQSLTEAQLQTIAGSLAASENTAADNNANANDVVSDKQ